MSTEDKLRDYILSKYQSLREFTQVAGFSYSTVNTILRRGIDNSNVSNIIKICKILGISVDGLADGEIVPIAKTSNNSTTKISNNSEIVDILNDVKNQLIDDPNLTIDGHPATKENIESIVGAMDVGVELAKRNNKKV